MKKLLALLSAIGIVTSASAGVVSCSSSTTNLSDMNFNGYDIPAAIDQGINEAWFDVPSNTDANKTVPRSIHFFLDGSTNFANTEVKGIIYYAVTYTAIARSMGLDLSVADATGDIAMADTIAKSELTLDQVDGKSDLSLTTIKPNIKYSIVLKATSDAKDIVANSVSKPFDIEFYTNHKAQFDLSRMNFASNDNTKSIAEYLKNNISQFEGHTFGEAKNQLLTAAFDTIMLKNYWKTDESSAFAKQFGELSNQLILDKVYDASGNEIANWSNAKIALNQVYSLNIKTPNTGGISPKYTAQDVMGESGQFKITFTK